MSLPQIAEQLTPAEAGFVLGRSVHTINKAVDEGPVKARMVGKGQSKRRLLGPAELRFFVWDADFHKDYSSTGRRRIYTALKEMKGSPADLDLGGVKLDIARIDQKIRDRLQRLERARAAVDGHGSGEPTLRGANIPVYVIAGLARGQTVAEIGEDYPGLSQEQIQTAIDYARAYPKRGRPYPARSMKRMLGDMATEGVFEVESAEATPPLPAE